ncbi:hypothetical protein JTE90_019881 [Oedothorax gibbosus]|uniref:Alpha-latrotoxin n=1 Tax=Oedothorax gibbosus TaxID=931172 RepID=A0AAV6VZH3_9ARAC|nr:hypothetical protein JTE90_019881 [Oedothorax gibbosus]
MNQFRNVSVTESEKLKMRLFSTVLSNRFQDIYYVKATRDQSIHRCHHVMVDCDKRQQFHKRAYINLADNGIILETALGHEIPQSFKNREKQFVEDLVVKPVMVKLQKEGYEIFFYLVSEFARENNFITTASSEDEIRRIGRILYCSIDEEPIESFCDIIVRVYFGLAEYISPNDNELLDSVRKGELQRVRTYLEGGGDVNFADKYGRSLLHFAAHSGNLELVRFLKQKGANIQIEDKICGRKPIHIAAKEGHPSVISFFHDVVPSSINECDNINWTPLHYAVWKGDLNTIKFLVENGAKINAEEIHAHKKPIHIAAEHAYDDVMEYLLENGANIKDSDFRGRTPLYHSVLQGHLDTSKFLIGKGADINTRSKFEKKTLLHAAVLGRKEFIEFLVKAGLDINEKDIHRRNPLHHAAFFYEFDILQVLADLGADFFALDKDGQNALVRSEKKHAGVTLHIVYWMCKKLQEEGKYKDAVELYNENLVIIKELSPGHPKYFEYLEMQNKIGVMLYEMGQYDKAETTFKDVLGQRERFLGPKYFSTLRTKHGLALVYSAQIRYSEAMNILKEVLESRKTILDDDHDLDDLDMTLTVSRDLANVHYKKGEYDEALEIFTHVFEKRSKYWGSDHPQTLQAREDMAVILVNKGDFKMALQIFKDILQKRKIVLDENHPEILKAYIHVKLTSQKIEETTPQGYYCKLSSMQRIVKTNLANK